MSTKHTPGPWTWDGRWLRSHAGGTILWYTTDDNGVHAKPDDALLIEAAPDLLAALKELVAHNEISVLTLGSLHPAMRNARAAIAKVKGGAA